MHGGDSDTCSTYWPISRVIAHAVRCLPLCDILNLQLELRRQPDWPDFEQPGALPPNVIRFRPRRRP
jgi:hypothetical protein